MPARRSLQCRRREKWGRGLCSPTSRSGTRRSPACERKFFPDRLHDFLRENTLDLLRLFLAYQELFRFCACQVKHLAHVLCLRRFIKLLVGNSPRSPHCSRCSAEAVSFILSGVQRRDTAATTEERLQRENQPTPGKSAALDAGTDPDRLAKWAVSRHRLGHGHRTAWRDGLV
jgi:hypothetical protein